VWFHAISLPHVTHSENGCRVHTKHEFLPPEPFRRFTQRTCPIHYFRSKTHVWGGFAQFLCRTSPIPKMGVGVHIKHEFSPPEPFLRFAQRTCPIHYFRSKTHVWGGFAQFRCRMSPIPKTGVGVHTKHEFLSPEPFLRFYNEHAQSTTLGPKLMFGVDSRNFVAARHPFQKRVSGCIQNTSFRHRNHFFVFRNEHAQSTTLGPKLMFGVVSSNFVVVRHPFPKRVSGCIQSTSFCHQNQFFVFRYEHAQSTTLGPKLMFGWFLAISLPQVTHSENGCRGAYKARVFANGTILSFLATKMPNPQLYVQISCLGGFAQFRCRTSPIPKTGVGVHTKHEFSPSEPFLRFSQRTCPIHYFRSKTHVWGGFEQFRCRTSPIPKTGVGVHTKHKFLPPEPILHFSLRTCPIHYFRSKTHVWGGFSLYRCRKSPIPKTGVGVHTKHEFLPT
jgi:hypothetical protein